MRTKEELSALLTLTEERYLKLACAPLNLAVLERYTREMLDKKLRAFFTASLDHLPVGDLILLEALISDRRDKQSARDYEPELGASRGEAKKGEGQGAERQSDGEIQSPEIPNRTVRKRNRKGLS